MKMRDKIEYGIFLLFAGLVKILGVGLSRRFAILMGDVFYFLIPIRKKVVEKNLIIAFPELSGDELRKLVRKNYRSICITFVELLYLPNFTPEKIDSIIRCPQIELIRERWNLKKGVFLLTAHFGNWEVGAVWVAFKLGIPFHVLVKAQRNAYVTKWLEDARQIFGNKIVNLGVSVRNIYEVVKKGEILGIVGDQRGPKENARIKFFGRDTAFQYGTASIALKTKSPILVGMIERQPDKSYFVHLEEITYDNLPEGSEAQVLEITQRYISILEKYIRRNPDQWFWMHNIWKY